MPDEFTDESSAPESIPWEDYLGMARRRAWYVFVPLFIAWLVAFSAAWFLPTVYRSGTQILVEQPTVPTNLVQPNITSDIQGQLDSITQQILSRTRLLRIIQDMSLYPHERQKLSPDEVVDRMRKDISIDLVRAPDRPGDLTSFNIYYSAKDPVVAQKVTEQLTWFFINENLEDRQQQSENTTQFFQAQLEQARASLADQEKRLKDYKDQFMGQLPGQMQSNVEILNGLQMQLQSANEALNRAKQQNTYLESLLGQYRSVQSASRDGKGSAGLPALDAELSKLRAQLADLSSHYTDQHPDVRKLKEQIARTEKMKQQLQSDMAKNPQSDNAAQAHDYTDQPGVMELQSQLKANQIEVATRQRAIQEVENEIRQYRGRLEQAPKREQELASITRDYDQSRTYYDSLLAKKNQSELATNLEKRQQGQHFRILDPPSLPTKPYSPDRFKLSLIGLFAGLVLGAVTAGGAELMDDRIYSEKEMKKCLPIEVLAEIPLLPTRNEQEAQKRKMWYGWAVAAAMLMVMLAGVAISILHA